MNYRLGNTNMNRVYGPAAKDNPMRRFFGFGEGTPIGTKRQNDPITREDIERAPGEYLASGRKITRLVNINTIIPNEIATSIEEADRYIDQSWTSEF